jgi:hypothetical protein
VDEAFVPLHKLMLGMTAGGSVRSQAHGIEMVIHRFSIDSPIELDLSVHDDGSVAIGSVPPLYRVETTFRPSYHQIRFTAELTDA